MRRLLTAAIVVLLAGRAASQEKAQPKPDPRTQAASSVLAAFKAKDEKALRVLAEQDDPDPWLVVDELCSRGEYDAAEEFAKAAPRTDTAKLPAYVAAQREEPTPPGLRRAFEEYRSAFATGDVAAALGAIQDVRAGNHVVTMRAVYSRGYMLRRMRRGEESAKAFIEAAVAAERMGWLALASEALKVMHERKIDELPVVDRDGKPVGMVDVQDLLDVGVV